MRGGFPYMDVAQLNRPLPPELLLPTAPPDLGGRVGGGRIGGGRNGGGRGGRGGDDDSQGDDEDTNPLLTPLLGAWRLYSSVLDSHPLPAKALTAGCVGGRV